MSTSSSSARCTPAIIEPGRFTFSCSGEAVLHLDAQLTYSHRGVESALEGRAALEAAPAVARICGGCSAARSWAYAIALEELAGFACDETSELARVVIGELERVHNHLFDLASSSAGAGYGVGQMAGMGLKEHALRLCALATGHRLLFDAIQPGGVRTGVVSDPETLRREIARLREEAAPASPTIFRAIARFVIASKARASSRRRPRASSARSAPRDAPPEARSTCAASRRTEPTARSYRPP